MAPDDRSRRSGDAKFLAAAIAALIAAVAVAGVLIGIAGGSTSVEVEDPSTFDPESIADGAVIASKHRTGGLNVFGIQLKARDGWLTVALAPAHECIKVDDAGQQVLISDGACGDNGNIGGQVLGEGITPTGLQWVQVKVDVEASCFEATSVGDSWPLVHPSCS
jgi:hypothetical protein